MASEIALVIWTDGAADRSVAHAVATEAAASIHRASGLATAVADFSVRTIEPADCVEFELPESVPAPTLVTNRDAIEWAGQEWVAVGAYEAVVRRSKNAHVEIERLEAELEAATDALAEATADEVVAPEVEEVPAVAVAPKPRAPRKPRPPKA